MESKELKKVFDQIAKANGFEKSFGSWFKKSDDCIAVIKLQKSSFGNSYYINIKVFIQGVFEESYVPNKDLIKSGIGHINQQIRDLDILDFDVSIDNNDRIKRTGSLFSESIAPFVNMSLSKISIKDSYHQGEIFLLPAVKEKLDI